MKFNKGIVFSLSTIFLTCFLSNQAIAEYPEKEVKIIVNYGVGGGVDRTARSIQRFLPDDLGATVLVENHKGAGGKIGYKQYLKQKKDMYNILCAFIPALTNVGVKNPGLVDLNDLAFINVQWSDPALLVAHKDAPFNTLKEMIEEVRKNPGKYSFSIGGQGAVGYLLSNMMFKELGLKINMVPYASGGKSRAAIQGGHVQLTAAGAGTMLSIKDEIKPLALFWDKPNQEWPGAILANSVLKEYNVTIPDGAAYRFFAVSAEAKEKYPEDFKKLVAAFKKTTTENKGFSEFTDKTKVSRDWYGPEKSTEILIQAHQRFNKMLKAAK
ncbi:MAG: hypothetical protein BA866_11045 [Desulfobulbaceae bacterium S5133MH15]|nr:MAG: hypothetical protein BA866_11045 [Desulfobulbaceae bacterium S5133MH15]OEU82991.1 MAG: hypothetical protein BA873_04190 [Desulfobulbaceae bacterium C00003063]